MPEYLSPGVYVEEIETGPRPIEGVSTSTAGFLGPTLRGPLEPRLVTGFEQFRRIYGGYLPDSFMAYGVDGFFKNGGQRCFIARITPFDNNTEDPSADTASGTHDTVNIQAIGPGEWGNRIAVIIGPGGLQDDTAAEPWEKIKLTVLYWDRDPTVNGQVVDPTHPANATNPDRREPTLQEDYDNLSADRTSVDFFVERINAQSNLIRITAVDPDNPVNPSQLNYNPPTNLNPNPLQLIPDLGGTPGTDGPDLDVPDYGGFTIPDPDPSKQNEFIRTGLAGFTEIDEIAIVCAPDLHGAGLGQPLIDIINTHCTRMGDRFAVLHSSRNTSLGDVGNLRPPVDSTYAAFYFPWIKIFDPRTNQQEFLVPPSGHVAGIYAKTDTERGVFKAPANAVVQGANGLQFQITKGEQDLLNPRGVNCLRVFPARGLRVWGARTCSTNTLWKYINVRRLFLMIEESIDEGTQWVVFEPNDERLWGRVRQTITQFLTTQWREGALMGSTPEEAFFVKVDRTTMTDDDIANGRLICLIGIAPVRPAEFVIFRISQLTSSANA